MRILLLLAMIFPGISAIANRTDSLPWSKKVQSPVTIHFTKIDAAVAETMTSWCKKGSNEVFSFFQKPFNRSFDTYIFPSRQALTEQWRKDWNMPDFNSECWMVASGIAHRLDLLSPRVWTTEACDHNGNDSIEIQHIITHEMVHVYHAQQHGVGNYEGMEGLDWLVEGLATYASGQLTEAKLNEVRNFLKTTMAPQKLAEIWKGKLRYQLAGSITRFIDKKYGRETLISLTKITTTEEILSSLRTTEAKLVTDWIDHYK